MIEPKVAFGFLSGDRVFVDGMPVCTGHPSRARQYNYIIGMATVFPTILRNYLRVVMDEEYCYRSNDGQGFYFELESVSREPRDLTAHERSNMMARSLEYRKSISTEDEWIRHDYLSEHTEELHA